MSLLARFSARQLPRCGRLHVVTIRHFAEGKGDGNADRGEPAAAVPNTPSPFQLTPEFLKQEHASELARRIPQNQRKETMFFLSLQPAWIDVEKNVLTCYFVGGYTPQTLLTAFGRGCETKLPDVETLSWEELFRLNNQKLNKLGLGVQERKYVILAFCLSSQIIIQCIGIDCTLI
ncbi:hypothetical protein FRC20_009623 [Serendipita sp. 405]|nr:hypothetical protein FRC20_009623 [Serendipita sp. 405]